MVVTWDRIRYRIKQFAQALLAPLFPIDEAYVRSIVGGSLSTPHSEQVEERLWQLFCRLRRAEQHHAIAVCKALEAEQKWPPELLAAALYHDVGKAIASPRLLERVWVVVVEHFAPAQAKRWSKGAPRGIGRGFVVRRTHAEWGASLLAEAGAPQRVVDLVRSHHSPPSADQALLALERADDR